MSYQNTISANKISLITIFFFILKIQIKISCISNFMRSFSEFFLNLHDSCVCNLLCKLCVRKQLLIFFFYLFSWDRSWRIILMKFFYQNWYVFFIIIYNSHILCLYSSHLIKSLNCVNFMFHFMSLIKLTKYRSSLFSTIMSCDNDIYLSIRLFFKNHNKLTWNIE